jgi:hypothetical protein
MHPMHMQVRCMDPGRFCLCVRERGRERGQGQQLCATRDFFLNSEQKSSESSCCRFRRKFVCKQCEEVTAARHSLLDRT